MLDIINHGLSVNLCNVVQYINTRLNSSFSLLSVIPTPNISFSPISIKTEAQRLKKNMSAQTNTQSGVRTALLRPAYIRQQSGTARGRPFIWCNILWHIETNFLPTDLNSCGLILFYFPPSLHSTFCLVRLSYSWHMRFDSALRCHTLWPPSGQDSSLGINIWKGVRPGPQAGLWRLWREEERRGRGVLIQLCLHIPSLPCRPAC